MADIFEAVEEEKSEYYSSYYDEEEDGDEEEEKQANSFSGSSDSSSSEPQINEPEVLEISVEEDDKTVVGVPSRVLLEASVIGEMVAAAYKDDKEAHSEEVDNLSTVRESNAPLLDLNDLDEQPTESVTRRPTIVPKVSEEFNLALQEWFDNHKTYFIDLHQNLQTELDLALDEKFTKYGSGESLDEIRDRIKKLKTRMEDNKRVDDEF